MPMEGVMKLTKNERVELQRQASARNGRADSARRARLILLLAQDHTWAEIRAKLDCSDSYIDRLEQALCGRSAQRTVRAPRGARALQGERSDRSARIGLDEQTQACRWLDALVLAQAGR